MAITEHTRHVLHQKLDSVLGPEEATTLMEHLPPVGWAKIGTKSDFDRRWQEMFDRLFLELVIMQAWFGSLIVLIVRSN